MTTRMTIADTDWTIAETAKGFENSETPEVAAVAADTVDGWLIMNTPLRQDGWTYTDGTFTFPASDWSNLVDKARDLITEANDYAVANMAEIRELTRTAGC